MPPSHCSNSSRRRPPPSRAQQPRPPFFGSRRIPHNNHVGSPFAPGEAAPQAAAAAAAAEERAERNGSEQGEQCGSPPPRCFFRFRRTVSSVRRALSARHLSSQISSLGDGALRWGLSRSVGKGGQQQGECALEREDEEEFFSPARKSFAVGFSPPSVFSLSLSLSHLSTTSTPLSEQPRRVRQGPAAAPPSRRPRPCRPPPHLRRHPLLFFGLFRRCQRGRVVGLGRRRPRERRRLQKGALGHLYRDVHRLRRVLSDEEFARVHSSGHA